MISPRGYSSLYAFELFSHRLLRYLTPFLHLLAFLANLALLGSGSVYVVAYAIQVAAIAAAAARRQLPGRAAANRPLLLADHALDRRRPLGPLPPGTPGGLGEGPRDPLSSRCREPSTS